ncbi:ATP-binding protein [Vibrio sp. AK197]
MRMLIRLILIISLLPCVCFASWQSELQPEPNITSESLEIQSKVAALPDSLFIDTEAQQHIRPLLIATLNQQVEQLAHFQASLNRYRHTRSDKNWRAAQANYLTLNSLGASKERLIELADTHTRERLTGFGPYGVTQFKLEWNLTLLNAEYLLYFQLRSFQALVRDLMISPIPVIWAGIKVLLIYCVLIWWLTNSKRLITLFHRTYIENKTQPAFWVRCIWYLSQANRAIAWLIAITLSLRVLSTIPSLQHLIYLEILTWWVLGGSIAISFLLEFAARNSRSSQKETLVLRLKTIRRYVWSIIFAGVILQISMRTLGKTTIYYWITSALYFWFIVVTISALNLWRKKTFCEVESISDRPAWVNWAVRHQNTWVIRILATAIAIVWLITHRLKLRVMTQLSNYQFFSQALAYLFRIEVSKSSGDNHTENHLTAIKGDAAYDYVLPGSDSSELIDYATQEIEQLGRYLLSDSPSMCVVSGERGIGSTTVINQLQSRVKNATAIYVNCPYDGYSALLRSLNQAFGLADDTSEVQLLTHLRQSENNYFITIDNAQRLVKPMVGGLKHLIHLTNLLRRTHGHHRVLFAIEKASWNFIDRARGERLLFDFVAFLPRWNEKQMAELLSTRINHQGQKSLSFDGLTVPKQWDQDDISEEERAMQGFFRILWHYSDGNPTIALRFFRLSLRIDKHHEQAYVRLFNAPQSQELEKMPKPMLAVLRSVVQLEVSSPEEVSQCTQLSIAEVLGTLRYFQSRGFIEWSEEKARISDHWFRHITNVLDRQHLLVK